jgi:hypothetical protein
MYTPSSTIPKWIYYYAIFLTILSFNTSILGYFFPEIIFSSIDLQNSKPVLYFYAARNVGIFFAFMLALKFNNPKIFLVLFTLRFVVEFLDLIATLQFHLVDYNAIIIGVIWTLFFLIPEGLSVFTLYKLSKSE